jgi:hypothetical protein
VTAAAAVAEPEIEPVIEPTVLYVKPAIAVTIGADGSPAFMDADAPESAADSAARS